MTAVCVALFAAVWLLHRVAGGHRFDMLDVIDGYSPIVEAERILKGAK